MTKIIAPNKKFTGRRFSVDFVNGVGETSDEKCAKWFAERGYDVEKPSKNDKGAAKAAADKAKADADARKAAEDAAKEKAADEAAKAAADKAKK